jgi:RimJ/RimL family protein N-acetyltransferase
MNAAGRVTVRPAAPADAPALIPLFERLYEETSFLLQEPGETRLSAEEQAQRIERTAATDGGAMFVAEADGALVGVAFGMRGGARRIRHSMNLVIGVLQAWTGQGVGRDLMTGLEAWARSNGLHRLELSVDTENARAIALYEKLGFEREGLKRHAHRVGSQYRDAWLMAKLLD